MDATVTLYRPTGPKELQLVTESGYRAWPPRLTWQPIFYPVLKEEYATQIAREWNATDPSTGYRPRAAPGALKSGAPGSARVERPSCNPAGQRGDDDGLDDGNGAPQPGLQLTVRSLSDQVVRPSWDLRALHGHL